MARVSGLGGVFYKVADPDATKRWYAEVLEVGGEQGTMLPWALDTSGSAFGLVTPFAADSDYFAPSTKPFMLNLRVDDLDGFLEMLAAKGVEALDRQDEAYGRFAWIVDCDGIKIELWQPVGGAAA